ncbi:MAG TPA: peptide ABC transporter substrate-binding protein [Candidatus Saccharimonadales bacterium]|nr:peptide ABC transporter substrate-binding protein [Candidatus Saccharimonadales bacterium]
MTRRDKLIVIGLIALLAFTSAGAIVLDRPAAELVAAPGGTYVEGVAGVPQYLDPLIAATNVDADVSRLLFTGLMRFDRGGSIVTDLAASFSVDPAGKIWTFAIRPDAVWHDGVAVTADDVLYTVALLQDRSYLGPFSDAFRGVTVSAVDAKTVRFVLPDVYAPFAGSTTVPLLPSHLLAGVSYSELSRQPFNLKPVGTGPFRFSDLDARQITLVRSDDFYRTKPERARPYLDRIILRFFRDQGEALAALSRGEIDGTAGLSPQDAGRARSLRSVNLYSLPSNDFTALFLNVRPDRPVFRDKAVRQAIATAIDRGRVLQVSADGRGAVSDEFVPPTSWAYAKDVQRYSYSVAEARTLLDQADWKDHDGDGIRDREGTVLKFSISTSDEPARIAAAQQIAADLLAIGIRVEVKAVPFAELVDKVARQRAFDALLVGITVGSDPDPYAFFHSSQVKDPGDNFSGYNTLALDRALESGRRTFDQAQRKGLYASVFQAIAADVPVVFLYNPDYLYAQSRTLNGFRVAPVTDPTQRFWNVEDWYLKTAARR